MPVCLQALDNLGQLGIVDHPLSGIPQPSQFALITALVVFQNHRVEQHRHGRRRRDRTGHRIRVDIRAQQIEVFLNKGETHSVTEIRRIDQRQGGPLVLINASDLGYELISEHNRLKYS